MKQYFSIIVNDVEIAKQNAIWGTLGKSGKDPIKYVRLIDCETEHLQAILKTQSWHISRDYIAIIRSILDDRKAPYVNESQN